MKGTNIFSCVCTGTFLVYGCYFTTNNQDTIEMLLKMHSNALIIYILLHCLIFTTEKLQI